MAAPSTVKTFGLREVQVAQLDATYTPGTPVALPAAQELTFKATIQSKELKGNDVLDDIANYDPRVEGSITGGGVSLDLVALLTGGTVATTGTTPDEVKSIVVNGDDRPPWLQVQGRAVNPDGTTGSIVTLLCVKPDGGVEWAMKGEEFVITKCNLKGKPHPTSGDMFEFGIQETATAL